jgi:hypothetical protein
MPKKTPPETMTRGPVPERLKLEGSWGDAIKKTLSKKKPPEGWPKDK